MGRHLKIRTCGIYDIVNIANGKHYIGQSVHIERRLRHHRRYLKKGSHINQHLQNAWNLYGESTFDFNIAEVCQRDKTIMREREQHWMDTCDSLRNGYNIWHSTESTDGFRHDAETILLLRQTSPRKKPVIQFDLTGNIMKLFHSAEEAERETGVHATHIRECGAAKTVSAGGFLWAFEDIYVTNGIRMRDSIVLRKPKIERAVVKLGFDFAKVCEFDNLSDAARSAGTSHCAIRQVCLGNAYCVDNHRWMFKNEFEDVDRLLAYKNKVAGRGRFRKP
jgi:hypothetical protein